MKTGSALAKLIAFAVVTVLAVGFLATTIANVSFGGKNGYHAVFQDVTGLAKGQEVRIAGVRVGTVGDITQNKDRTTALVDFEVERSSVLTQGTIATIKYRNLVGERYIALTQGEGDAGTLKDGGTIPIGRTNSALDLTVLFNGFKPLFAALSPKDVNEFSGEVISVLQGEGGNVNALLARTASLTSAIADRDAVIGRTVTNLNTVLGTIDQHDEGLKQLVDQLQRFISGLSADREVIGASLTNINDLTAETADLVQLIRPSLKEDIKGLDTLSTNLNKPANTAAIEKFLSTSPGKISQITRTATYGSWFNFYLCNYSGQVIVPALPGVTSKDAAIPVDPKALLQGGVPNAARCGS